MERNAKFSENKKKAQQERNVCFKGKREYFS